MYLFKFQNVFVHIAQCICIWYSHNNGIPLHTHVHPRHYPHQRSWTSSKMIKSKTIGMVVLPGWFLALVLQCSILIRSQIGGLAALLPRDLALPSPHPPYLFISPNPPYLFISPHPPYLSPSTLSFYLSPSTLSFYLSQSTLSFYLSPSTFSPHPPYLFISPHPPYLFISDLLTPRLRSVLMLMQHCGSRVDTRQHYNWSSFSSP